MSDVVELCELGVFTATTMKFLKAESEGAQYERKVEML
jgi:hypothetical protein